MDEGAKSGPRDRCVEWQAGDFGRADAVPTVVESGEVLESAEDQEMEISRCWPVKLGQW